MLLVHWQKWHSLRQGVSYSTYVALHLPNQQTAIEHNRSSSSSDERACIFHKATFQCVFVSIYSHNQMRHTYNLISDMKWKVSFDKTKITLNKCTRLLTPTENKTADNNKNIYLAFIIFRLPCDESIHCKHETMQASHSIVICASIC